MFATPARPRGSGTTFSVEIRLDQSYDPALRARQFDLFRPQGQARAALLMFHGGGWISGDRRDYRDEAHWYAQQGVAALCIGYRLAPLHPFPAAIDDVLAAVRYVRESAADLNLEGCPLVGFGNSAGGHLAAMVGHPPAGTLAQVDATVAICPITDLQQPSETHFPIALSFLEQFMGGSFSERPEAYAQASPMVHVREGGAPTLLIHGTQDEIVPVDQSRRFADALSSAGIPVELHLLEGEGHSFSWNAWSQIRELTLDFVDTL